MNPAKEEGENGIGCKQSLLPFGVRSLSEKKDPLDLITPQKDSGYTRGWQFVKRKQRPKFRN